MKNLLVKVKDLVARHWKIVAVAVAGAIVLKECL
jgi:hypothetical protein